MGYECKISLVRGDCIDSLRAMQDCSVDLIITDPGYESIEKHRYGGKKNIRKMSTKDGWWSKPFPNARYAELFSEYYRVLKEGSHLYIFSDTITKSILLSGYDPDEQKRIFDVPPFVSAGFKFGNDLVWVKTKKIYSGSDPERLRRDKIAIKMGYHYRKAKEYVLFFKKGKRKISDLSVADVFAYASERDFPTQKPLGMVETFIRLSSDPGDIVLDSFAGSGVVGLASYNLGRSCVLIDMDTSYIEENHFNIIDFKNRQV
jgi:site-specific DNA-methyltransferase (adenine-specific)